MNLNSSVARLLLCVVLALLLGGFIWFLPWGMATTLLAGMCVGLTNLLQEVSKAPPVFAARRALVLNRVFAPVTQVLIGVWTLKSLFYFGINP